MICGTKKGGREMDKREEIVKRTNINNCKQCDSSKVFMNCYYTTNKLAIKICCFDCGEAYYVEKSLIGSPNDELDEYIETCKQEIINNWNKQRND